MPHALPTLVVSRRPRRDREREWTTAHSWLGGRPRLGANPWPRTGKGEIPLTFVAQIDLVEILKRTGASPLPERGSLAFFVGGHDEAEGAVVYVPTAQEPTPPPPDTPAAYVPYGDMFVEGADPSAPREFPYWPVHVTVLEFRDEAEREEPVHAVDRQFTRREYFFTADQAYEGADQATRPWWWHSGLHYAASLQLVVDRGPGVLKARRDAVEAARAHVEKLEPKGFLASFRAGRNPALQEARARYEQLGQQAAKLETLQREFERFASAVQEWARGREPFSAMSADARNQLASFFKRGKAEFADLARYGTPDALQDLETETLVALATAGERAYATMPDIVKSVIDARYLLPPSNWHQMFGHGVDIQGAAVSENAENILLLQLVYDDMMHWNFGDMGAYQFWISPHDLAQRNWRGVRLTFECH